MCSSDLPSPIVPVFVGADLTARLVCKRIAELGVLTNLVEYPAVSNNSARLRMQVMTDHAPEQCITAAEIIADAMEAAQVMVADDAS